MRRPGAQPFKLAGASQLAERSTDLGIPGRPERGRGRSPQVGLFLVIGVLFVANVMFLESVSLPLPYLGTDQGSQGVTISETVAAEPVNGSATTLPGGPGVGGPGHPGLPGGRAPQLQGSPGVPQLQGSPGAPQVAPPMRTPLFAHPANGPGPASSPGLPGFGRPSPGLPQFAPSPPAPRLALASPVPQVAPPPKAPAMPASPRIPRIALSPRPAQAMPPPRAPAPTGSPTVAPSPTTPVPRFPRPPKQATPKAPVPSPQAAVYRLRDVITGVEWLARHGDASLKLTKAQWEKLEALLPAIRANFEGPPGQVDLPLEARTWQMLGASQARALRAWLAEQKDRADCMESLRILEQMAATPR